MDIVRDGTPERKHRDALSLKGLGDDREDAHWALIPGWLKTEQGLELSVLRAFENRHRSGVWHICQHRSQHYHRVDLAILHHFKYFGGKGKPAPGWFSANQ